MWFDVYLREEEGREIEYGNVICIACMIPRLFFRFLHLLSPVNTYIFRTQLRQVETFVSTFLFSMFLVLSLFHQQKSFFRINKITIDDHSFTASLFYFLLLLLFLLGIFADRIDLDRILHFYLLLWNKVKRILLVLF